jgi:hypothetical protein
MPGPLRTFTPSAPATTYGVAGVAVAGIAVGSGVIVDDGVSVQEGAGVSTGEGALGSVGDGGAVPVGQAVACADCADTATGDGVPVIWSSSSVHAKPYQVSPIPSPTRSSHPTARNVVRPRPCRGYRLTFIDGLFIGVRLLPEPQDQPHDGHDCSYDGAYDLLGAENDIAASEPDEIGCQ